MGLDTKSATDLQTALGTVLGQNDEPRVVNASSDEGVNVAMAQVPHLQHTKHTCSITLDVGATCSQNVKLTHRG